LNGPPIQHRKDEYNGSPNEGTADGGPKKSGVGRGGNDRGTGSPTRSESALSNGKDPPKNWKSTEDQKNAPDNPQIEP